MRLEYLLPAMVCVLAVLGCSESFSLEYEPRKHVGITVSITRSERAAEHGSTSVYAKLYVENSTNFLIEFDPSQVTAENNGIRSTATYFDSLASVMPKREKLSEGVKEYSLYFVFPGDIGTVSLDVGGEEWGRRTGVGAAEGRRRAHRIKQRDRMSGATDNYTVDPVTGDVFDPEGEWVGNLNDPG